MKDTSLSLIALQIITSLGAVLFLFISRFYPITLVPALILLGGVVFLACYSRHGLFSVLLIGIFASLILSLRFEYLPWGDPWSEYGMVQRIIAYQSINPTIYPSQLPVIHIIITTISLFSRINPLYLLKYVIPPLSVIGLYAVYRFTKDISSEETAFFAGILLLCGTPYLHWTTQGVRETIGIALFVLALYLSFSAIKSQKRGYLFVSLLLIGGLVLTHHLSSMMFLSVWIAVSLTYLYLMCVMDRIRTTSLFSLVITLTAAIFIIVWWVGRQGYEYTEFNRLMNTVFHSEYGILLFLASLILLYLIPLGIPDKILSLRSIVHQLLMKKNLLYAVFITGTTLSSIIVLNFVLGKSSFVLNYPLPMLFNGVCMIVLSLIGIYYFLEIDRFHILAWIVVLVLILILSMSNIVPFVDPLRFMEFLYIPLAIIAAFGVTRIMELTGSSKFMSVALAVFVVLSVVTSFPSVVFFGEPFEPGHPLFDNRSWVIEHKPSEISAISWLDTNHARGVIETDAYAGYAVQGISFMDSLSVQSEDPFQKVNHYPSITEFPSQQHYLLILSRMKEYTEFGAQWMQKKEPLNDKDLRKINNECNILYTNGNGVVYSNGNGILNKTTDRVYTFGYPEWIGIVGDWDGNGKTKIGVYKYGRCYLDSNGNGVWDDATDIVYTFGYPAWTGIVGDWDGSSKTKIGVYKDGVWHLDSNGNGVWDEGTDIIYTFGSSEYTPISGDWDGNGKTKIGVYKAGLWYLDYNGNGVWDEVTDKIYTFGSAEYTPISGDWDGNGKTKIGVYKDGVWYLNSFSAV